MKLRSVWAHLNGRDYVTPEHVTDMARRILPHRPLLVPAADPVSPGDRHRTRMAIVSEVIEQTVCPV